MDQPTHLDITVKGTSENVKRAALAIQKRIDFYASNYNYTAGAYELNDDSDFNSVMDNLLGLEDYEYTEDDDGSAEYTTEQDSYELIEVEDIEGLAREIITNVPEVEFHISAVITITYADGFDLCVDIDYADGKMNMECSEEYYDNAEDEDEE